VLSWSIVSFPLQARFVFLLQAMVKEDEAWHVRGCCEASGNRQGGNRRKSEMVCVVPMAQRGDLCLW